MFTHSKNYVHLSLCPIFRIMHPKNEYSTLISGNKSLGLVKNS